jgi:sulfur carrier protein
LKNTFALRHADCLEVISLENHQIKTPKMNITINNKPATTAATSLQALADELSLPSTGVAVAVGNQMVPRSAWATTPLSEGADIVIIRAVCGG